MAAFYNDNDAFAVAWLRQLMERGVIAPGKVDERSIEQLRPDDLVGFDQCHFFAGIGTWSCALRRAGWPDERRVWTGSCPCQPFSVISRNAGGLKDLRHLWPVWFRLIRQHRPDEILGEQVASTHGLSWFDVVCADLESEGYAIGACDSCAAGYGAPEIRQRLYFAGRLGFTGEPRLEGHAGHVGAGEESRRLAAAASRPAAASGDVGGFWGDAEWIPCRDGKDRPIEPGSFPLVDGAAARVGRLRGYGNALVAPQAEAFIAAYLEATDGAR